MATNDTESLIRLGKAIVQRRAELGISQDQVRERGGPSDVTIRNLELGEAKPPRRTTLAKIDDALEWTPGSAESILQGGDPAPLGTALERCTTMEGYARFIQWQQEVAEAVEVDSDGTALVDLSDLSVDAKLHVLNQVLTAGSVRLDLVTASEGRVILAELTGVFERQVAEARRTHPEYRSRRDALGLTPADVDEADALGVDLETYARRVGGRDRPASALEVAQEMWDDLAEEYGDVPGASDLRDGLFDQAKRTDAEISATMAESDLPREVLDILMRVSSRQLEDKIRGSLEEHGIEVPRRGRAGNVRRARGRKVREGRRISSRAIMSEAEMRRRLLEETESVKSGPWEQGDFDLAAKKGVNRGRQMREEQDREAEEGGA